MSTDATLEPLAPAPPVGYALIPHHNSNRSRRRGLCGYFWDEKLQQMMPKHLTTVQTIRHPEGGPLPHTLTPALVRSMRSKYTPHVGKKQLSKLS